MTTEIILELICVELPEKATSPPLQKNIPEFAVIGLPERFPGEFISTRLSDFPVTNYQKICLQNYFGNICDRVGKGGSRLFVTPPFAKN